jgi:hypothetical protein
LRQLIDTAERTNTKLLLLTADGTDSAHSLTTALQTFLPWAHRVGTPSGRPTHRRTAFERAQERRAEQYNDEVAHLMRRCDRAIRAFDDLTRPVGRNRDTGQDRSLRTPRSYSAEL